MTHTYSITGMTCKSCVAKVKSSLLKLGDITEADVQLASPQATISMQNHIKLAALQAAISKAGNYTITETEHRTVNDAPIDSDVSWLATYKPILLIFAFIIGITLLTEVTHGTFFIERWMTNFMAGFFLVFAFFKLLDLKGFASSYSTYDIIAKRWQGWGYVYAFLELGLGLAYLTRFYPLLTNGVSFAVMAISLMGVVQSVINRRQIKCACLGAVFNLPMSTITIVEDGLMIVMSGIMLITML
ncbi:MAG: heavy-metal-associated protein [Flaviaesturariibacter sp.]|nr:heavy-metal-associated protein [Flaviaesturariibacter sp.]